MDTQSIATEIADRLEALDSVATATLDVTGSEVTVVTQGGVRYLVTVMKLDIETETAATEGE